MNQNYGRRGGRVAVNRMQYAELLERVDALEKAVYGTKDELTKPEIIDKLKESGVEFNPRDKKDVLLSLLNKETENA